MRSYVCVNTVNTVNTVAGRQEVGCDATHGHWRHSTLDTRQMDGRKPASATGSPPRTTNDLVISTEGDEQHAPVAIERVLDDDGSPRSVAFSSARHTATRFSPDWTRLVYAVYT